MKYRFVFVVLAFSFIGCANRQNECPRVPERMSPCVQCWESINLKNNYKIKTVGTYVGESIDSFLVYMKRIEKHFEIKIDELKISNPELIEAAEKQLEIIRTKIREYEKKALSIAN